MNYYIYNLRLDSFFTGFNPHSLGYVDTLTSTWHNDYREIVSTSPKFIYAVVCSIYIHTSASLRDLIVVNEDFDFTNPIWLPVDGIDGLGSLR